ncbi:MAG: error-prone DNA polymerase [Lautropia sp.]
MLFIRTVSGMIPPYAELHCLSNFSFLRGASHPEELVDRALELGYSALAITDECSLAGVVRAHLQARGRDFPVLVGAQFTLTPPPTEAAAAAGEHPPHDGRLVLIARNRNGYGNLAELITTARCRAGKGEYRLFATDFDAGFADCVALWVPRCGATEAAIAADTRWLHRCFGPLGWLAVEMLASGNDAAWLERLTRVSGTCGVPMVAAGDVHFHVRSRKMMQDTLTAIRLNTTLDAAGLALAPNAEQHLRSRVRLAQLYPPALLEETIELAAHCHFSLEELRYEYPEEIVPPGHTPASWLRALTLEGAQQRYPEGLPAAVSHTIEHELALIAELRYEPYFLTVADIVRFARERGILCQGRGSAANSAVCYCIGITEVDPSRMSVLFERFISRERNEPPDIDVDFEHQRREEVIQYLYAKYGRRRAALTATVICYRTRSAIKDVGRALGIDVQRIEQFTRSHQWWDGKTVRVERLREAGFDPDSRVVQHWIMLATTLLTFPRHLSQHTGGFVIARDSLARLVPIENAAMADRNVIQWDKDDLDALGILKVDVLALGMLTAIRRCLELITQRRLPTAATGAGGARTPVPPAPFRLQDIPAEDPDTYEMICRADTVGVFQIESRAQMSMLPRLQPRCFYDLVVEVAIVRPGPIQGGMVHPYLRRRQGLEDIEYPKAEIKPALERTLGIPIFQEQVMQIAIMAAGFAPGEADQLRRSMAAWKRKGGLSVFQEKLIKGMLDRGYEREFAERLFRQIEGFAEYGFPESHAASFALLVYVSCWLKRHEPAAFLAAMLNSQPMGFYAPAQLVRDAREHGIDVRAVDVTISDWACTLEEVVDTPPCVADGVDYRPQPAVRLGLNRVAGLSEAVGQRIVAARIGFGARGVPDVDALARAAALDAHALQLLARANALAPIAGHRAEAAWVVSGIEALPGLLAATTIADETVALPRPGEAEETVADYRSIGIPMGRHPLSLLRPWLDRYRIEPASVLRTRPDGSVARASGIVTHRQRPETAKGIVFLTIEDDTGAVNVIVWPDLLERHRKAVLAGQLLTVYGIWQRDVHTGGQVTNLLARRIVDHSALLGRLTTSSRNFR